MRRRFIFVFNDHFVPTISSTMFVYYPATLNKWTIGLLKKSVPSLLFRRTILCSNWRWFCDYKNLLAELSLIKMTVFHLFSCFKPESETEITFILNCFLFFFLFPLEIGRQGYFDLLGMALLCFTVHQFQYPARTILTDSFWYTYPPMVSWRT